MPKYPKIQPVLCDDCGGSVTMCPHNVPNPTHQQDAKSKLDNKNAEPYPNYQPAAKP